MRILALFSESFTHWREDKVPQLAASTAYYTIFSLAPLLVLIIAVLSFFFDATAARTAVLDQIGDLMGKQGAEGIGSMIDAARTSTNSTWAAIIGIVTLILGATGVMMALEDAVNFIWKVKAKKTTNGIVLTVLRQIFSLGFILGVGFLLLISLMASVGLSAFASYLARFGALAIILPLANVILSFCVIWILFAILLRFLPDVKLTWSDVLPGSALTAALFVIGKSLLGWYLGQKDAVSAYGVAGSLIIVLLWVNYSSQIFFFGVEFTKVYTLHRHRKVLPKGYAEWME